MSKIGKFEDIKAWQLAREVVKEVYRLTKLKEFSKDFELKNQIRKSAVSAMSNIAEGFERNSKKEFIQFLYIAKGSVSELRSQLYVALDMGYINNNEFQELFTKTKELSKVIFGFIKYLRSAINL
jgi:four helix bundle protein